MKYIDRTWPPARGPGWWPWATAGGGWR